MTAALAYAAAYIVTQWRTIAVAAAACLLCLALGYCEGKSAGEARADAERAAANAIAITNARNADEVAAVERVTDAIATVEHEKDLTDAIAATPDTLPDPTRVALGCQRLRAAGTAEADLPAVCGRAGGDGGQAGADR